MNLGDEMQEALQTFITESRELLEDMENMLLSLEQEADPLDSINAIFRAAHTIKGSSGMFGLDHIVLFTHAVESVLDKLRAGQLAISSELISILLPCRDHISAMIDDLVAGQTDGADFSDQSQSLMARLQPYLALHAPMPTPQPEIQAATEACGGGPLENGNWHLSLRFGADSLRNGMDPLAFIRYLAGLGDIVHIVTVCDALVSCASFDPESCYLGFEIDLKTQADKETIEGVFDFVREDSQIHILPPNSCVADYLELIRRLPEDDSFLGEILVKGGIITRRELEQSLQSQAEEADEVGKPIGAILVEQQALQQPLVDAALEKQKQGREQKAREAQTLRVDADRLDRLIDLVGELIIACAGANLCAAETGHVRLQEANAEVVGLVEQVRDSALQLRMVPIGATFTRFQRVVRDVSAELGKDIALQISGGETEVDKSVAEKIADPLMHLVRNSMDHGIETAEARLAAGKPVRGTLQLNAYHDSGNIVIEVGDDGGGLNRDKILAKATERGLVAAGSNLSDQDIYKLIFEPGFSTADQVSNLSGRGVGMDVVKRNISALRGSIDIKTQQGQGTVMRINLPLTLAIIDGFQVSAGTSQFVIPLNRIVECVELPGDTLKHDYMDLRGEVLPLVHVHRLFDIERLPQARQNVVVLEHGGHKCGVVVDELRGELQTVIKPLGDLFAHLAGLGGSTILGNGEIALILDVAGLLSLVSATDVTV